MKDQPDDFAQTETAKAAETTKAKTITRTTKFEVRFVGLRRADASAFQDRLRTAQRDLVAAANRGILALLALKVGVLSWPVAKGRNVPIRTLTYQLTSGAWEPMGPVYRPSAGAVVSSVVRLGLASTLNTRIGTDWPEIRAGRQSAPSFKHLPLVCGARVVHLDEDGRIDLPIWSPKDEAGKKQRSTVSVRPIRLDSSVKAILTRCRSGAYKLGTVSLLWRQPKNRKGKWYILLSYTAPVAVNVDAEPVVAGVDIGVDVLAAIALVGLDGKVRGRPVLVPFPEVTLRALRHRQAELRSRRLHFRTATTAGRGRGHATRAFASAEDKIARATRTAFEQAASSIVATAKRYGATILAIEDHKHWSVAKAMDALPQATNAERARYRRAYMRWHQGALRELLEQYGEKHGLEVKIVDPAYSSQTCSACGARWANGAKVEPGVKVKRKPASRGGKKAASVIRRKGKQAVGLSGAPSVPEPEAQSRLTFGRCARATFLCDCNRRPAHADINAAINLARWATTGNPWRTKE